MPILDLQQQLVEVGRLRMGEKVATENGKTRPAKLAQWRLTSKDRKRIEAAAERYGGEAREWEGHRGEWECYTGSDQLKIKLIPGQALTQWMELWGQKTKGKGAVICLRRCDSQRDVLNDVPCQCPADYLERRTLAAKGQACKETSRLSVIVADLPGLGMWRLESHGHYAAVELNGTATLLEEITRRGQLVPARLRMEKRDDPDRNGNSRSYVVPVIDIDTSFDGMLRAIAGGQTIVDLAGPARAPELEAPADAPPFTPVPVDELPPGPQRTLREQIEPPAPPKPRANAQAPIPPTGRRPRGEAIPPAVEDEIDDAELIDDEEPVGGANDAGGADGTGSAPTGNASAPSATASTETVDKEGAQRVAMWCNDAGIGDGARSAFLYAFSDGTYRSSHNVPVDELGRLRATLDKVRNRVLVLDIDTNGERPPVLRAPDATPTDGRDSPPAQPPPAGVTWRALLANAPGIGQAKLLRRARVAAGEHGLTLPTSLDDIPHDLDDELRQWLDAQSDGGK